MRAAAFDWLGRVVSLHGEVLPYTLLKQGFEFQGERIKVVGPQGIFQPARWGAPLSVTTSPNGPYDDAFDPSGRLRYRFRGNDPTHRDNQSLVFAKDNRLPLVYFHGILTGRYLPIWPVYVVQDLPEALTFLIEVDDAANLSVLANPLDDQVAEGRRQYVRDHLGPPPSAPDRIPRARTTGVSTPMRGVPSASRRTPRSCAHHSRSRTGR